MTLKVLGISTSPRVNGNSDLLLRRGWPVQNPQGHTLNISVCRITGSAPCIECNLCYTTGACAVKDDYQQILTKMLETDRLIFATPIFFMNVCAQAKALIDRGQCLWAHKYVLKKELIIPERDRRAMVIAVGGSKSTKQFESIRLTMSSYLNSLQMHYVSNLFVNKIDAVGEIEKHPSALKEAHRLGGQLVTARTPPPQRPSNVELI